MATKRAEAATDHVADFARQQREDFAKLWGEPKIAEIAEKRRAAWESVRWYGRHLIAERRMFHETKSLAHHREWRVWRSEMKYALENWKVFRDWHESLVERAEGGK